MGKGGRNHSSKYRIVKHSAEYYKKQRELKHRREQAKAIRDGHIFVDESALELKVELNPNDKMPMILALPKKKKEPDGVKC